MLKDSWIIPIAESVHLAGIAMMAGAILLRDFCILAGAEYKPSTRPTAIGFTMIAVTGPLLFVCNMSRYLNNPAFLLKMLILAMAIAAHFTIRRSETRTASWISIVLWTCVVLSGRAIADFDV